MRGESERQATMMLGLTPEGFVPKGHPLRRIKSLADLALGRMSPLFDEIYADNGWPLIPPEHLLKSSLLMASYTIRSERQFCEQLSYLGRAGNKLWFELTAAVYNLTRFANIEAAAV